MKLNLDYYKEELDNKQISEEYEEVLNKIQNYDGEDFSETLDKKSKIKNIIALSNIRENILNWYEFKNDASILEINCNYGEITGLLCERASKVVSIESSKKYADIIEKRHRNKENLELIVGDFLQIEIQEKFDYIVVLGLVKNLEMILNKCKEYLKDNGIILLGVDNKFGVKSWITTKEESKVINNSNTAISREKLEKILENMNYKYYYPLPDYKLPNIIYTDNYMPSLSNIYRDLTYKDENVNFKEVDAYREIIENNPEDFKKFANSFLLEISNKQIKDNEIKFITFSNIRKDEYRIKTIVTDEEVYKTNVNSKSKKHIEKIKSNIELLNKLEIKTLDSYKDETIISKYSTADTLEEILINKLKDEGKEVFISEIKKYQEFLKEKLILSEKNNKNIFDKYKIEVDRNLLEKLTFVKHGFWDLIFQNCFIIDNEYYFYDQEWYEENIPIEYILYRAIIYSHESKKYMSDSEVFEELGINEFTSIFEQLDDKIQEKIRKQIIWNIHTKEELERNKYSKIKNELQQKDIEILNLKNQIGQLKQENINKNSEIMILKNSFSWKITKPLRFVRRMTKNK